MIDFSHLFSSFSLVAISEIGDKTQLLAFTLASRFRKPVPILLGIFVATLANHALASGAGTLVAHLLTPKVTAWILGVMFVAFGFWALVPDKLDEEETHTKTPHGAFWTTLVVFFIAEMGDKTQLATVALAARYNDIVMVTMGTTLGMMVTNGLSVFLGDQFAKRIDLKWVRRAAAALFFAFGISSIVYALV